MAGDTSERPATPREHAAQIELRLDVVQELLSSMTCAIALLEFADAWIASCLIVYELHAAELQLAELTASPYYPAALQRLGRIRDIASTMLPMAPLPSSTAVRELRSSNWTGSRPEWTRCEREWRLRQHKPRISLWRRPQAKLASTSR